MKKLFFSLLSKKIFNFFLNVPENTATPLIALPPTIKITKNYGFGLLDDSQAGDENQNFETVLSSLPWNCRKIKTLENSINTWIKKFYMSNYLISNEGNQSSVTDNDNFGDKGPENLLLLQNYRATRRVRLRTRLERLKDAHYNALEWEERDAMGWRQRRAEAKKDQEERNAEIQKLIKRPSILEKDGKKNKASTSEIEAAKDEYARMKRIYRNKRFNTGKSRKDERKYWEKHGGGDPTSENNYKSNKKLKGQDRYNYNSSDKRDNYRNKNAHKFESHPKIARDRDIRDQRTHGEDRLDKTMSLQRTLTEEESDLGKTLMNTLSVTSSEFAQETQKNSGAKN